MVPRTLVSHLSLIIVDTDIAYVDQQSPLKEPGIIRNGGIMQLPGVKGRGRLADHVLAEPLLRSNAENADLYIRDWLERDKNTPNKEDI